MLRRTRIVVIEIAVGLLIVLTAILFWVSHYINSPEFRERFVAVVSDVVDAPVSITGDVDISLYPSLSLEVKGLVVEGPEDYGGDPLVEFDAIRIRARLLPLLNRHVDLKTIMIDGMTVNLVQGEDGRLNWRYVVEGQHRVQKQAGNEESAIEELSVSGVEVANTTIRYKDLRNGTELSLSGVQYKSGELSPEKTVPFTASSLFVWEENGVEAKISLSGLMGIHPDTMDMFLSDVEFNASLGGGFLPAGSESATIHSKINVDLAKRTVEAKEIRCSFLGIQGEGSLVSGPIDEELDLTGKMNVAPFNLASVLEKIDPAHNTESVKGLKDAHFTVEVKVTEEGVDINKLLMGLDDMSIKGDLHMKGYATPVFYYNLVADKIDLDRYSVLIPKSENGDEVEAVKWQDVPLNIVNLLQGRGSIKIADLKVADTVLKKIELAIDGLGETMSINAKAMAHGGGALSAQGTLKVAKGKGEDCPVLSSSLSVSALSENGFSVMEKLPVRLKGDTRLHAKLDAGPVNCLPESHVVDILRKLRGSAILVMGKGGFSYDKDGKAVTRDFSKAEMALDFKPDSLAGTDLAYRIDFSLRGNGGKRSRSLSLVVSGPIGISQESVEVRSPEMTLRANVSGPLYTDRSSRAILNTKLGFDTGKNTAFIKDAHLWTLDTTVKGSMVFSDLDTSFKAKGNLEVLNANVRRVIFLLSDVRINTEDVAALRSASIRANVRMDEKGVSLTDLTGELDGMELGGNISGNWSTNPKILFALKAGEFDLDRYLSPSSPPPPDSVEVPYDPVELPLEFFRWLNVDGTVAFEEFKLVRTRTRSLSGRIKAEKGRIHVANVKGSMNNGRLTGDWTGLIRKKDLTTDLSLSVKGMDAGAFMVDVAKRDYVRGKTDMDFQLSSMGLTDFDIVKNLNGEIVLDTMQGSYKFTGYDISQSSDRKTEEHNEKLRTRRTSFSRSHGQFDVRKGVLEAKALRVEAPVLQSHGSGYINLPDYSIDLSIRNDFVAIPSVTVRIFGDLGNPEIRVPKDKIVSDTVFNILSIPQKSVNFLFDIFK